MVTCFRNQWISSFLALAVMLQMLLLQGMAASCELHDHFHDHSDGPDPTCAVLQMQCGGYACEVPVITPVDVIPELPAVPPQLRPRSVVDSFHLSGGVLAHAPPRGP